MLCIGIRIETVDTGPGWRVRLANADTFAQAPSEPADKRPLVVDLDGTLVKSDLLHESLFARVGRDPASVFSLLLALRGGRRTSRTWWPARSISISARCPTMRRC
jgi:hypothetical protein